MFNLDGGIRAWRGDTAYGPPETGMDLIEGLVNADEIIVMAYGLEEGLRSFYEAMAQRTGQDEANRLFSTLAAVEDKHKQRLFDLYKSGQSSPPDRDTFESEVVAGRMEGGFTTDEMLDKYAAFLETGAEVIDLAMSIEVQALDLYMRHADKVDDHSKRVLFDLADEEREHLEALGKLRERVA